MKDIEKGNKKDPSNIKIEDTIGGKCCLKLLDHKLLTLTIFLMVSSFAYFIFGYIKLVQNYDNKYFGIDMFMFTFLGYLMGGGVDTLIYGRSFHHYIKSYKKRTIELVISIITIKNVIISTIWLVLIKTDNLTYFNIFFYPGLVLSLAIIVVVIGGIFYGIGYVFYIFYKNIIYI